MGKAEVLADRVYDKIRNLVKAKLTQVQTQLDSFEETVDFLCFFRDFWISFCM